MHHPRSHGAVARFRISALLLVGICVLVLAAAGLLVHSVFTGNRNETVVGSALLPVILTLVIVQWVTATSTGCPLCRTPVMAPKRCMKHRRARTLLGSHRLRVAMTILFKNQFRCPYCGESTEMAVRETLRRRSPRSQPLDACRERSKSGG